MTRLQDTLWTAERTAIAEALRNAETVTVSASEAQSAIDVTRDALRRSPDAPSVELDFARLRGAEQINGALIRATVAALTGERDLLGMHEMTRSREQTRALLELRRELGGVLDHPDELPAKAVPATVRSCLGALRRAVPRSGRVAFVVHSAERALVDKELEAFMWALRSDLDRGAEVFAVFCGGPAAPEITTTKKAPFFGWGAEFALGRPRVDGLTAAVSASLQRVVPADYAADVTPALVEAGRRCLSVTEELVDTVITQYATDQPLDLGAAWSVLAQRHANEHRVVLSVVSTLHRWAVPVLQAVAGGRGPYTVPGLYPSAGARALLALRIAGLIDRPSPRQWQLVNPLLAAWLNSDGEDAAHSVLGNSGVSAGGRAA